MTEAARRKSEASWLERVTGKVTAYQSSPKTELRPTGSLTLDAQAGSRARG
jgi:hypothetical protein